MYQVEKFYIKIAAVVLSLFVMLAQPSTLSAAARIGYQPRHGYGTDYVSRGGDVMTHAVPAAFPDEGTPLFNVKVDGGYVGLYRDRNFWGGLVHFGSFEFTNGHPVTILISYYQDIRSYELLPARRLDGVSVRQTGHRCLCVTMSRADQNLTIVINGDLRGNVLHLFANSIDTQAPAMTSTAGYQRDESRRLIYFGPGYYDLKKLFGSSCLQVKDRWQVYIAAGAVVYGSIALRGVAKGTRVCGRGMVYNDSLQPEVLLAASNCTGADVAGITLHGHRAQCWQVIVDHCHNVEMKNVKIISTRYASTDGLDVVNSEQCAFLGMFIRASDDAVAIKGLGGNHPADNAPSRNLTFCNMQLWNDCNNAFGIGAENHCAFYEHIRLMNSSILFSYDDPNYHEQLDERAAMGICCIHGTYFRDILFDNVDVYHCERLIALGFHPDFWFGALKGDQTTPGGMQRITFSHINVLSNSGSRIANKINLKAWRQPDTPPKDIDSVAFNHVIIDGHQLQNTDDSCFSETNFEGIHHLQFQ